MDNRVTLDWKDFPEPYKKEEEESWDFAKPKTGIPAGETWDFPKPTTRTRGSVAQEPGSLKLGRIKDVSAGGALPDTYGIAPQKVEAPEEEPYPGTPARVAASLYSNLLERSLYNAANIVTDITGQEGLVAPITGKLEQQYAYERVEAEEKGFFREIAAEVAPALESLFGVLIQVRGIGALLAATGGIALGTKPSPWRPLTQMAGYRLLTSKGTAGERIHQAAFTTAASITPLIINKTGATGFGAVACDSMLNMILSNKTYLDAIASAEDLPDFIKKISAQLVIDIGLAWNTRGGTEMQLKAAYDKYEKQAGKLLTLKYKDFTDLVGKAEKIRAEENSIERKVIPKFSQRQWKVTDEKSFAKLGKALAKEVGLGDWDIKWEFVDKITNTPLYTGFAHISNLHNKEAIVHIDNPKSSAGVGAYDPISAGKLLSGIRGKTHGNLVKTLLHEFGHLGKPTSERVNFRDYKNRPEAWKRAMDKAAHDKEFHKWTEEHKSDLWKEEETVDESVARRMEAMKAEEKGEPLLTFEEANQFVPDYTKAQELTAKIKSIFGVQDVMKNAKAPETGFALKNFPNMVSYGHNKGLLAIKEIVSMAKKMGIPKNSIEDFAEITYAAESGKYRDTMSKEALAKIQPMIDAVNVFYKQWESQLKEIGWMEVPFPQSLINRNLADIKDLEAKLKDADDSQAKEPARPKVVEKDVAFWKDMESLAVAAKSREGLVRRIYKYYLDKEYKTLARETEDVSEGRPEVEEIADLAKDQAYSKIAEKYGSVDNFIKSVGRVKKPTPEVRKIQKQIADLKDINQRISEENLSFVSVPIRMILRDKDAAITKHFMSLVPKWGRKTITVKDLVEEGVITEKETDIRTILGEYTNRMSKKYALGLVFKAAEEEGMVKPASEQPNWQQFDTKISPQLKGKVVHPVFNDLITAYIGAVNAKTSNWQQFVGLTKMMQFYNPLFLPMYDVVQGAAAGSMTSWKTPYYLVKGIKDVLTNSENMMEAARNNIFSKPFYLKEDAFTARLNKHIEPNTIKKLAKGAIPMVYTLSWNTAWKLDEMVRMATYNYFKDKGMDNREAAQTAAMFHGDYASLPPNTRRTLNTVFFTPTFKIAMTKLGTNMVRGAVKTAFDYEHATKSDKAYAGGLVRAWAILEGLEQIMHHMGYETDEQYRKYTREAMTDEGLKESVITFSHPLNLIWRYWYRGKKALEPDVQNKFDKFCEQAEYELTPIYNIALRVRRNEYNEVYNPNDSGDKQIKDATKFILGNIVAISKTLQIFESPIENEEQAKNVRVLKDQIGELEAQFISPFIFHYTRDIESVRLQKRIMQFKRINANILDMKEGDTPESVLKRYDNYIRKLEALYNQMK